MDIYTINLASLLALCGALFLHGQTQKKSPSPPPSSKSATSATISNSKSHRPFLTVYALVMGSDWLQGPFLYPLYREEHHLQHGVISALFTTGFLSGAVSGAFIGTLADRYGRKRACLFFCLAYAFSCLFTCFPGAVFSPGTTLVLGRVLGGLSTSLLFSVFESWMVADFEAKGEGKNLSGMFGTMSMVNSLVAIASGVASEWLVGFSGSKKAPFMASVAVLGVAFGVIALSWDEYYGNTTIKPNPDNDEKKESSPPKSNTSTLSKILSDPKILCLGLASTIFEGSMFLFVFFWTPALSSTITPSASSSSSSSLPYGVIFASFMASCLAASLAFNTFMSGSSPSDPEKERSEGNQPAVTHATLLLILLGISSITFFLSAHPTNEQVAFWVFCLYEAAVGAYWPTMGTLKGKLIDDGIRSQVYGLLRVPLNVFVVVSLILAGDGAAGFARVFETCGMLLSGTAGVLWVARSAL